MLTGLGTSLYYPLTGCLENQFGWRTTLLVLAASLALTALPAHLGALPERAAHAPGCVSGHGQSTFLAPAALLRYLGGKRPPPSSSRW
jgi:predicted MFS family arabinose efflux permease